MASPFTLASLAPLSSSSPNPEKHARPRGLLAWLIGAAGFFLGGGEGEKPQTTLVSHLLRQKRLKKPSKLIMHNWVSSKKRMHCWLDH